MTGARISHPTRTTPVPQTPAQVLTIIIATDRYYGRQLADTPLRINVEFASAPPAEPLDVAHGRGAVIGDCIATLLEWQGHMVQRECYVNDVGEQVLRLGEALWSRVQQAVGRAPHTSEFVGRGAWLGGQAQRLLARHGWLFADQMAAAGIEECRKYVVKAMKAEHRDSLAACRVRVDVLFPETRLYTEQQVARVLVALRSRGLTYDRDGACWLKAAMWGEVSDVILRDADGRDSAVALEIAYHDDRASRGFDRAINVREMDDYRAMARVRRAMMALGHDDTYVAATAVRPVTVLRDGGEVTTSPRPGEALTLRDLVDEVGADAVRWFFLMEAADTLCRFDLDRAAAQTQDNPLWLVREAHARTAALFRAAGLDPARIAASEVDPHTPTHAADLVKVLADFPLTVRRAADSRAPDEIARYCVALARAVHDWHDANPLPLHGRARLVQLAVARATDIVLTNALDLLGVTTPERLHSSLEAR